MANTYIFIQSYTVGSGGASEINFTSIPQTYTDLVVLATPRNTQMNYGGFALNFNNSSSSITQKRLRGEDGSAYSDTSTETPWEQSNWTSNTFGNVQFYIPNYTSSNYKSVSIDAVAENNGSPNRMTMGAWLWSNTSAITSIKLTSLGSPDVFAQYSTAYLYGISNS